MGPGFSSGLGEALVVMFIAAVAAAFAAGMLMMWGIPKLWHVIMPWLHAVTG